MRVYAYTPPAPAPVPVPPPIQPNGKFADWKGLTSGADVVVYARRW